MRNKVLFFLSFVIASLFFLSSCSSGIEEKTYYLNSSENTIQMTYSFKDNIATSQSTENKISYDNLQVQNENEARKVIAPSLEIYKGMKGVSHELEYYDDHLIEKIKVDYTKVNNKDLSEISMLISGGSSKDMTPENIDQRMKELGFYEDKDKEANEINEYNKTISNFYEISVKDIESMKNEDIILFVGFKECPYCRIFAPKLLKAKNNNKIYYLDTNKIGDSKEEEIFLEKLEIETVPALFIINSGGKIDTFEFESSTAVKSEDIGSFLNNIE